MACLQWAQPDDRGPAQNSRSVLPSFSAFTDIRRITVHGRRVLVVRSETVRRPTGTSVRT